MRIIVLRNSPLIDMFFVWDYWDVRSQIRFNNGNVYHDYAFGPIRIRKFLR